MARRRAPAWLTRWEYAHRGLHSDGVPENSMAAAEAAVSAGLGIECDIQRSGDGVPMVFHDWELERLTNGTGETAEKSAETLANLTLLDTQQHPSPLADFLTFVSGRVPLLIEIKSKPGYDVERTCQSVRTLLRGYAGDHAVMSFDPRVARWFRRHSVQTPCGLVMREDDRGFTQRSWQRRLAYWIAKPDFLAYHIEALPNRWVERLRVGGLPILTWTVASPGLRDRATNCADALVSEGEGLA